MRFAILLAAGFLKRKLGSSNNPITAKQAAEFAKTIAKRKNVAHALFH